jgi:hypothetical protein
VIFVAFFSQILGRKEQRLRFFYIFFSQFLQPDVRATFPRTPLDPRDTTPYQNGHHTAIRSGLSLPILLMILPFFLMIPARFLSQLAFLELKAKSELDGNKSARPMEEPCCAPGFECIS